MKNARHSSTAVDFADVIRPLAEARSLPPWCYSTLDFYKVEVEHIFLKTWNCVGHASRIREAGDCFSFDIAGIPLLIVRGSDNVVRAFANSCRHRGTRLVEGKINCRQIICPYHAWTYDLDGRLLSAPTSMKRTDGFDPSQFPLKQVRLEEWNGFLFVNCDPNAESFLSYVGDLTELLRPYELGSLVQTWSKAYSVNCNWKNYLENARDQLHVATVHRKTFQRTVPVTKINRELLPSNGAYSVAFIRTPRTTALLDGDEGFIHRPQLSGRYAEGTHTAIIYPGLYVGCAVDCAYSLMITPIDVAHTRIEVSVIFPAENLKRPDFETVSQRYHRTFTSISDEDNAIVEAQFKGLNSPLAEPGPFSWREEGIHWICRWVTEQILKGQAQTEERAAAD
jgi:choline monooxygenase